MKNKTLGTRPAAPQRPIQKKSPPEPDLLSQEDRLSTIGARVGTSTYKPDQVVSFAPQDTAVHPRLQEGFQAEVLQVHPHGIDVLPVGEEEEFFLAFSDLNGRMKSYGLRKNSLDFKRYCGSAGPSPVKIDGPVQTSPQVASPLPSVPNTSLLAVSESSVASSSGKTPSNEASAGLPLFDPSASWKSQLEIPDLALSPAATARPTRSKVSGLENGR